MAKLSEAERRKLKKPQTQNEQLEQEVDEVLQKTIQDEDYKEFIEMEQELEKDTIKIIDKIQDVDTSLLDFRKEAHKANKYFGSELRDIHRNQGKFILFLMIVVLISGICIGGVLVSFQEILLPFVGISFDGIRAVSSIAK